MRHRRVPIARRTPIQRSLKAKGTRTPKRRKKRLSLSKQADALWSQIVKEKGFCECCGKREGLQAAHGFSRRYRSTRWLPINGFCLCAGCHVRFTYDPLGWQKYLREAWGHDVYEELMDRAMVFAKPDLKATVTALKDELERRDNGN